MFDEYLNPLPCVASPVPVVVAPVPADSTEEFHDIEVAHLNNDPFFGVLIPEPNSEDSSSRDVIPTNMHSVNQPPEHLKVYVSQPNRFVDQDSPNHVYKLKKALYGLKQALRDLYGLLSSFLLSQKFSKDTVDPTLFTWKEGKDILLVQIYVDDIIFASTDPSLCEIFFEIMCSKFKMLMIGKMSFFPGLQISQSPRAFADADHAGFQDTRRSTSRSMQLLGSIRYLCIVITKVSLPYAVTTSNIPDRSILTSDTTSSRSKWKMGWLSYTSLEQNISYRISLPKHRGEKDLNFLSTSVE
ncbi:copia protein [Tanacetum coccineum]